MAAAILLPSAAAVGILRNFTPIIPGAAPMISMKAIYPHVIADTAARKQLI